MWIRARSMALRAYRPTRWRSVPTVPIALALLLPLGPALAQPADLELVEHIGSLDEPMGVRHAGDGSGRLFVFLRGGEILVHDGAALLPTPFLDLGTRVATGGEMGLLGLAFHPDYETNGLFFVSFVTDDAVDPPQRSLVERYQVSAGDPNVADPASATPILGVVQPFTNHNGGDIHFGPDGYLSLGLGDGGGWDTAQDMDQLLGKMLRIDVDSPPRPPEGTDLAGGDGPVGSELCGLVQNYAIPPDNPFVGTGDGCDEIWASGLRNPFRWSFDRATGDLLIGDVGEGSLEEIDFQPAASAGGENYGWPCREGTADFQPSFCPGSPVLVDPVLEYPHATGQCSVIGGFVYRGPIASMNGLYVYNDWCTGETWFASQTAPGVFSTTLWDTVGTFEMVGWGEDEVGNLYTTRFGSVWRFESQSEGETIFADGFESGGLGGWSSST